MVRHGRVVRAVARAFVLALLSAVLGPVAARAQDFDREAAFLTIPTGARPVGMGRAAASLAGDLQGIKWNPATVASITAVSPLVSAYDGPLEFRVNELAVAVPASGLGVFAVTVEVQSFGDIPLAGPEAPEAVRGQISPNNLIASLAFGRRVVGGLSFGLTAKWIRSELIGDLEGSTFAVDAGLLWAPASKWPLRLGLSGLNLGRALEMGGQSGDQDSPLPGRLRFAASYDVLAHLRPNGEVGLLIAADFERAVRDLGTGSRFLGVEAAFRGTLFVRAGYVSETLIETNKGWTVGVGLGLGMFHFDLARELGVNQLGDETHLTLGARF